MDWEQQLDGTAAPDGRDRNSEEAAIEPARDVLIHLLSACLILFYIVSLIFKGTIDLQI